jgi:hypothetical protein
MNNIANDMLLRSARQLVELVIARIQIEIIENGSKQHLLNRIRDLRDANDLLDTNTITVDLMEHLP